MGSPLALSPPLANQNTALNKSCSPTLYRQKQTFIRMENGDRQPLSALTDLIEDGKIFALQDSGFVGESWRRQKKMASCVMTLFQFISCKAALTKAARNHILTVVDEPGSV